MLTITEVSSVAEFTSMEPEWAELVQHCTTATPFQHPGWVIPWWKHLGSGELFVLAMRERGRLVAMLPLFLHPWEGRRQLTILGTGISDYLDLIAQPDFAEPAVSAVAAFLESQRERWDLCRWQDLPATSPLLRPGRGQATGAEPCIDVELGRDPIQFRNRLPYQLRRTLKTSRKRLAAVGEVAFETCVEDSDGRAIEQLFLLHGMRWRDAGEEGVLADAAVQAFHREVAPRMTKAGALRFYLMTVDRCVKAVIYGFLWGGRFFSYLGGYDPTLKDYSPGSLILDYAIGEAIRERARRWDFLRGSEGYKTQWGGTAVAKIGFELRVNAPITPTA